MFEVGKGAESREGEPVIVPLPSRRATTRFASRLAGVLRVGDVVFLEGPLGAGKTFLVRALCRALGVPAREPVQSPTFALVHEIDSARVPITHADLYRLSDAAELDVLGLPEAIARSIAVIEWGERFAPAITGDGIVVTIAREPRSATIAARGPRGDEILRALA